MGMNDKHNYDPTKWVDNSEPDIDAEHLNKIESALQEYGVSIDELAAAGGTAAKVKTTDTYGLVVSALGESTAQALIDAIANKVMNELINKNKIVNNLLATDASTVLAGTQGAALDKRLVAAENAVAQLNSEASTHITVIDSSKIPNYKTGTLCYLTMGKLVIIICQALGFTDQIVGFKERTLDIFPRSINNVLINSSCISGNQRDGEIFICGTTLTIRTFTTSSIFGTICYLTA
ncbi:hypothetical protein [Clostridium fessum]|uniref:hypothetical protein n=1 Tax=Clostridium fessum TaxID=2126740 RepID=UPI0022E7AA8E|nr:hypothetical protein [Clostridium fessum]